MQQSSSLPALNSNQSSIIVEDNVPGFVQSLIRDFLRNRGFEGTLRAFDYELKNPGLTADKEKLTKPQPVIPIVPSVRAWYEMSEQLDLTRLMERNRKSISAYPTLLEVMTREMVDTNLGKKGMRHLQLRRRRSTMNGGSSYVSPAGSPRSSSMSGSTKGSNTHKNNGNNPNLSLAEMSNDDLQRERNHNKKQSGKYIKSERCSAKCSL